MPSAHEARESEWRRGGMCLAAAIIGYAAGFGFFMFSANLFIEPMRNEFGWTVSEATFLPISSVVLAVCFPISGKLVDIFGPRLLASLGLAGFALCYLLLASIPLSVPVLRAIAVLFGICCALAGAVPFGRSVASWFEKNVGLALGLAGSGSTLGGVIGLPFSSMLIAQFGWRSAYLGMAGVALLVGLPAILLFLRTRKHSGETAPGRDDETPLEERASLPLSDERYWLLAAALAFCCVPIGIYLNHVQPILSGSGFDLASATALGSFFALATFGGRILAGFLLDRLVPRLVAAGCMALAALGAFLIMQWAGPAFPVFAIALILIGLAYGAEADFAAFFTLRYFGLARFSMVFGTLAMVIAFAVAFGGFIAAKSADTFGNYDLATSLAPAGFAVAALLILGLALFERPDRLQVREAPKISSH